VKFDDLTPAQKRKINKALEDSMTWDVACAIERVVKEERQQWAEAYWRKHKKEIKEAVLAKIDHNRLVNEAVEAFERDMTTRIGRMLDDAANRRW
jgi:hypothetical protein